MNEPAGIRWGRLLALTAGLVTAFVISVFVIFRLSIDTGADSRPKDDARHYVAGAYNIAKYGVFSQSRDDSVSELHPKYKREPVFSLVMAMILRGMTEIDRYDLDCLLERNRACADERLALVRMNQAVTVVLAMLLLVSCRIVCRSWLAGYVAVGLFLAGNYLTPPELSWYLYAEPLAGVLLLAHALTGLLASRPGRGTAVWAVASGIALGLLVLTKAVFQYWLVLLAIAALVARLPVAGLRQRAFVLACMVIPALLVAGTWVVRNYYYFGEVAVSERAGNVLMRRAAFASITPLEYRAGFCQWTPRELAAVRARLCAGLPGGAFRRFDRGSEAPTTFKNVRNAWLEEVEAEPGPGTEEQRKIEVGLSGLLQTWRTQLALVPLFAYRGAWVDAQPWRLRDSMRGTLMESAGAAALRLGNMARLLFMPALFIVVTLSLVRGRIDWMLFFMPALYSFAIHAVATHFIPRYSHPTVPILIVALVLTGTVLLRAIARRD